MINWQVLRQVLRHAWFITGDLSGGEPYMRRLVAVSARGLIQRGLRGQRACESPECMSDKIFIER